MIRAASLTGFGPLVEELGGDPEALLSPFGLSLELLADDDALVPITAHDLMLDAAAEQLVCPDLGLRLARRQDLGILGPLAVAIEASSTAGSALACVSRYLFVHSPALRIAADPDPWGMPGVVALTYGKDVAESPYSPQATELGLGLFHHVAGALVDAEALRSVEIPHAPISPVADYVAYFGADVKFDRPVAALRVGRRALDDGFATADEVIRRTAVAHLASTYRDPRATTAGRTRHALARTLATGRPALRTTARLLAVHPRTLQRRLAAEGTTFETVLDEVRRDTAHRLITTTDLPLTQVSALVGLGEQSSLSHAVRRWYGTSPRSLRRATGDPDHLSR